MEEIRKEEYFQRFLTDEDMFDDDGNFKNKIVERALSIALDTRKFEIELYWKRATYFWAFIGAMFVAYFAVFNSDKINDIKGVTILISALGYFFSLGWYFVNRGSKYWQENWETHVDLLGEKIQGELFTTIKISNQDFWKLNKAYPFSVSKVNQFLSLIMIFTWVGLFLFSMFFSFEKLHYFDFISNDAFLISSTVLLIILGLLTILFFNQSESFIKDYKVKDKKAMFFAKTRKINENKKDLKD